MSELPSLPGLRPEEQRSADPNFFDFRTRQRSMLVRLDKAFWIGMALSPDERSLV
jgi:hypothetical protein